MASEHFFHRARVTNKVERVWEELQKPSTWKQIGGVDRITDERFDKHGDLIGYRFTIFVAGTDYQGLATRTLAERRRLMVMGIDSPQLTGEIGVALSPNGETTWIELSLAMASKGLLSAMLFPAVVKAVAGGFDATATEFVNSLSN
ncbi:MAG TPA: hypothetical protein VJ935_09080 [Acidimicrobiia bacterium]|nr:hypothetical protein [Acidimicrobiia bacterium]